MPRLFVQYFFPVANQNPLLIIFYKVKIGNNSVHRVLMYTIMKYTYAHKINNSKIPIAGSLEFVSDCGKLSACIIISVTTYCRYTCIDIHAYWNSSSIPVVSISGLEFSLVFNFSWQSSACTCVCGLHRQSYWRINGQYSFTLYIMVVY